MILQRKSLWDFRTLNVVCHKYEEDEVQKLKIQGNFLNIN